MLLLLLINLLDFKASKADKTKDLSHISSSLIMTRLALLQTVGHSQWSNDSWMFDKYLCLGEPLCAMCTLSRLRQNLWSVSSLLTPFLCFLKVLTELVTYYYVVLSYFYANTAKKGLLTHFHLLRITINKLPSVWGACGSSKTLIQKSRPPEKALLRPLSVHFIGKRLFSNRSR